MDAFEKALGGYLRSAGDPRGAAIASRLDDYKRQYVGVVWKGQRVVFGNFFCSSWQAAVHTPVMVDDGGPCFFNVLFDPRTGSFSQLFVNGMG